MSFPENANLPVIGKSKCSSKDPPQPSLKHFSFILKVCFYLRVCSGRQSCAQSHLRVLRENERRLIAAKGEIQKVHLD